MGVTCIKVLWEKSGVGSKSKQDFMCLISMHYYKGLEMSIGLACLSDYARIALHQITGKNEIR